MRVMVERGTQGVTTCTGMASVDMTGVTATAGSTSRRSGAASSAATVRATRSTSRSGRVVPRERGYGYPDVSRYPDYRRYPESRYPNSGRLPSYPGDRGGYGRYSPASEKGLAEGYEKGLDDGNDGDRFAPEQHKWYREGDRGYKGSYGSRDRYKIDYREGFRLGYEQGYRDSRVGRTQNSRWPF